MVGVIEVHVAHGLTHVELLRLEKAFFHLDLEIICLVGVQKHKIKVLHHHRFHLNHLLINLTKQLVDLVLVEYLVFDAFVI